MIIRSLRQKSLDISLRDDFKNRQAPSKDLNQRDANQSLTIALRRI